MEEKWNLNLVKHWQEEMAGGIMFLDCLSVSPILVKAISQEIHREFPQIWQKLSLGHKDSLIRFWWFYILAVGFWWTDRRPKNKMPPATAVAGGQRYNTECIPWLWSWRWMPYSSSKFDPAECRSVKCKKTSSIRQRQKGNINFRSHVAVSMRQHGTSK